MSLYIIYEVECAPTKEMFAKVFLHKLRACMSFPTCWLAPLPLSLSHTIPLFMLACRIVELFPAVPINPHWGIVSKCLAYSKAACDPFVYSLLRHQYKKTCSDILNRLLKRSSLNASGRGHENQGSSIPTAEWRRAGWWDTLWRLTCRLSGKCEADLLTMKKKKRTNIGCSCPCLPEFGLTGQKKKSHFRQGRTRAHGFHWACKVSRREDQCCVCEDSEMWNPRGETSCARTSVTVKGSIHVWHTDFCSISVYYSVPPYYLVQG